jgi:hypothetical protein
LIVSGPIDATASVDEAKPVLPSHQSDPTASTNHIDILKPGETLMKEDSKTKRERKTEEKRRSTEDAGAQLKRTSQQCWVVKREGFVPALTDPTRVEQLNEAITTVSLCFDYIKGIIDKNADINVDKQP